MSSMEHIEFKDLKYRQQLIRSIEYPMKDGQSGLASAVVPAPDNDKLGRNALIYAVISNSVKYVKSFLKCGVDVDEVDIIGRSALHWAAIKNLVECTRILISAGAKCDLQDNEGATPLHLAAKHENSKCLQLIIKHFGREQVIILDNDKRTALHWSAYCANVFNFELLLNHFNVIIPVRDVAGKTALHWAACSQKTAAVDCIRLSLIHEIGSGMVNVSDYEGRTALHCAIIDGIFPVVKELVSLPTCNVNLMDELESTPMHWATILGKHEIVKLLLDHGALDTVHDIDGATPWHYAVLNNSLEILSIFLSRLSDPNQRDHDGCTPLMWAASKAADEAITLLCRFGADLRAKNNQDFTALHEAAFCGHSSTLKILLDLGATPFDIDVQGRIALFLACEMGHLDAVRTLLERCGSDVLSVVDNKGRTSLHWAASNSHVNVCQLLIGHGYDTNACDYAGRTPFHYATFHGYIDCMSVLKENGADPEYSDKKGWTALHYACKLDHLDAVKLLIDWNVNLNTKELSEERFTPLDLATINFSYDVCVFMNKKGGLSIIDIKQMAATIIQTVYRRYKFRKLSKIEIASNKSSEKILTETAIKQPMIEHDMRMRDAVRGWNEPRKHQLAEKRLSSSVEHLLRDLSDQTIGCLDEAYSPHEGLYRYRRKKFVRSELALNSINFCNNENGRHRLRSTDETGNHKKNNSKLYQSFEKTYKSNDRLDEESGKKPSKSVQFVDENSESFSKSNWSFPSWCLDPVLRRAAENEWLESLASITFQRVPIKSVIHSPDSKH